MAPGGGPNGEAAPNPAASALVGLADVDGDDRTDWIWRGQDDGISLTYGDGARPALPLGSGADAILLAASEWPVDFGDLDGDGRSDWLLLDRETGDAQLIDLASAEERSLPPSDAGATLIGVGDFADEGRRRPLWLAADGSLFVSDLGDGAELRFAPIEARTPLAIADLDGDGRDDVLAGDPKGGLALALAAPTEEGAWLAGAADPIEGLELLAAVDLVGDAAAELVWLRADGDPRGLGCVERRPRRLHRCGPHPRDALGRD